MGSCRRLQMYLVAHVSARCSRGLLTLSFGKRPISVRPEFDTSDRRATSLRHRYLILRHLFRTTEIEAGPVEVRLNIRILNIRVNTDRTCHSNRLELTSSSECDVTKVDDTKSNGLSLFHELSLFYGLTVPAEDESSSI